MIPYVAIPPKRFIRLFWRFWICSENDSKEWIPFVRVFGRVYWLPKEDELRCGDGER